MLTVVAMGMKRDDLTIAGLDALKKADHIVIKSQRTHMAEALKKQGLSFVSCDTFTAAASIARRLSSGRATAACFSAIRGVWGKPDETAAGIPIRKFLIILASFFLITKVSAGFNYGFIISLF